MSSGRAGQVGEDRQGVPMDAGAAERDLGGLGALEIEVEGCSQVIPIPPWSCTLSSATCTATSEHQALATAAASSRFPTASASWDAAGSESAASRSAAFLAAARARTTSSQRSAIRCLIAWKEPTGRANW